MPKAIPWTADMDAQLTELRSGGASMESIAKIMRKARHTIRDRCYLLNIRPPPAEQPMTQVNFSDPLPAGHPVSWGAITRGPSLEGVPFGAYCGLI